MKNYSIPNSMISFRYGQAFRIPRKMFKYFLSGIYPLVIRIFPLPEVLSIDDTLDKIISEKCSISRFGDGEFLYILDRINLPFQKQEPGLRYKLIEILKSNERNILVGLPIGYFSMNNLKKSSRLTWRSQISWIYPRLRKYIDKKKIYYNASITRPYSDYEDKACSRRYFDKIKKTWENREILLIEGEKSRLGVGNDLFENAASVQRILAPMHHAYSKYWEILNEVQKHNKSNIILVALGPTATAMAFDLTKLDYQAIDLGNLDIEYEWYLRQASEKVKICGKYTSEVAGGRIVEDINNPIYHEQIIATLV